MEGWNFTQEAQVAEDCYLYILFVHFPEEIF